jgi:hypothetical protein
MYYIAKAQQQARHLANNLYHVREELAARLAAADALAEAVPHLLAALDGSKEPMLYNQQEAEALVRAALRAYREAKGE